MSAAERAPPGCPDLALKIMERMRERTSFAFSVRKAARSPRVSVRLVRAVAVKILLRFLYSLALFLLGRLERPRFSGCRPSDLSCFFLLHFLQKLLP